jgi:cation transport ATPase
MTLITLVLPVFATVLAGWLARRSGLRDLVTFRGQTDVVFYLAMPALLFNAVVHGTELELLGVATVYFSACLIIFAIGAVSGRASRACRSLMRAVPSTCWRYLRRQWSSRRLCRSSHSASCSISSSSWARSRFLKW